MFWEKSVGKYKNMAENCLQTILQGYNACVVGRDGFCMEPKRVRR
jgi:hypothetical protein